MSGQSFDAEIPADEEAAERLHSSLRAWMAERIGPKQSFAVELLCREVIANAIEHGCRGDATKRIRLGIVIEEGVLSCRIEDDGPGFAPPFVADLVGSEPEARGRGLAIISHYADHFFLENCGRVVVFDRRVSGGTQV